MRTHRQSATMLKFSKEGDFLGVFDRRNHMAQEITCPRCESRGGVPCRQSGRHLHSLEVHTERMEDFL